MVLGCGVLVVISGVQVLLLVILRLELKKFDRARDTAGQVEKMTAAIAAVRNELSGLGDLVQTFGNRAAVRNSRRKKPEVEEEAEGDGIIDGVEFPSLKRA